MNHTRRTCTTDGSACIADGIRHAQLVGTLNVPNVCGPRSALAARGGLNGTHRPRRAAEKRTPRREKRSEGESGRELGDLRAGPGGPWERVLT